MTEKWPLVAAHKVSNERVAYLKSQDLRRAPGSSLSEVLKTAANAALLHHGMGRFKTAGNRLAKGTARLAKLIGEEPARRVGELCKSLESQLERPSAETSSEVEALVTLLIEQASDPNAPGATTL